MTQYAVWTSGTPRERLYQTPDSAITAAAADIYISPTDRLKMGDLLKSGKAARISYGFSGAEITIRR